MTSRQFIVGIIGAVVGLLMCGCGALDPFMQDPSLNGFTRVYIGGRSQSPASLLPFSGNDPLALTSGAVHTLGTAMNGGIMLYAVGVGATQAMPAFHFVNDSIITSFVLPNGDYNFYAVGYSVADFSASSGIAECGYGNDLAAAAASPPRVNLGGGSKAIYVFMSSGVSSPCVSGLFSPANYIDSNGLFYKLKVWSCKTSSWTGVTNYSSTCTSVNAGNILSFRIGTPSLDLTGAAMASGGVTSSCISMTSGVATTNLHVPLAGVATGPHMYTVIKAFADNSCTTEIGTYSFTAGISDLSTLYTQSSTSPRTNNGGYAKLYADTSNGITTLFLQDLP